MHCLACGTELYSHDREAEIQEAKDAYLDAFDEWLLGDQMDPEPSQDTLDESEHLNCPNESCPLSEGYQSRHHPFRGPTSRRGDSFSVSSTRAGRGGADLPELSVIHCPWDGAPLGPPRTGESTCSGCHLSYWTLEYEPGETLTVSWIK